MGRQMSLIHLYRRSCKQRYLVLVTLLNLGLGFSVGVATGLLGVSNALMWGIAAFLLNYVPFIEAVCGYAANFGKVDDPESGRHISIISFFLGLALGRSRHAVGRTHIGNNQDFL
jgi:hypothetical protein